LAGVHHLWGTVNVGRISARWFLLAEGGFFLGWSSIIPLFVHRCLHHSWPLLIMSIGITGFALSLFLRPRTKPMAVRMRVAGAALLVGTLLYTAVEVIYASIQLYQEFTR